MFYICVAVVFPTCTPFELPSSEIFRHVLLVCFYVGLSVCYTFILQDSVFSAVLLHSTSLIESRYTLGVWTWSSYCYLLLPVWALQWTLKLPCVVADKCVEQGSIDKTGHDIVAEKDKTE